MRRQKRKHAMEKTDEKEAEASRMQPGFSHAPYFENIRLIVRRWLEVPVQKTQHANSRDPM
jgi:hypothetical protein